MPPIARHNLTPWRSAWLVLATLAILMKILAPPGFMLAPTHDRLEIVLCTGHGTVTADLAALDHRSDQKKDRGGTSSHDGPCAFAGHGAGAPAPSGFSVAAVEFVAYRDAIGSMAPRDLAPGRGLAAPPLPARGPPILLT